ncbi:hypothetical protein RO3G_06262 [Rhizopus delemar RA 99-880]|uniref:Uncharacterized protein n=1 Tax=Rhizopus delemar (strain RA 99-880 / ATCC MYA-4621 / FGSC 9543 / NRRL 43880) TaxID=246409 RepID=I1BZC7_RHIO9|nr:hypothetical protein RO3G_06262 [Rhizopus delemar RA 99-880]|eukprot:EIE81557.1 hypothetical protein RO3G_06262 [Rhizopus delemar RA 99-880]
MCQNWKVPYCVLDQPPKKSELCDRRTRPKAEQNYNQRQALTLLCLNQPSQRDIEKGISLVSPLHQSMFKDQEAHLDSF